ncbi:MAG: colanic acid/amylovoran biosynthesis glycosyltransferase [Candidatus Latescibacterota bacterium]|jgi:colanic acid/amylovoran biosynthesis glycosyltransferase
MSKKIQVGHVIRYYLRLTETFIQSYLTHAQSHLPCVLTDILVPTTDNNTSCVYLIAHRQVAKMSKQERHFFLSKLDYPLCYAQTIVERQMDVLHAHFGAMGYRALNLKHTVQLPLVVSFYGVDASHLLGVKQWQKHFAQLFDQADVVTALGSDMAERLCTAGCPERKIEIVHLGVDLEALPFRGRVSPEADESIILLYCGRLVEKKGIFDALDAFARLADTWPQLCFRIVGDGVLRPQLKRKIRAMGLQERVCVLGAISHRRVLEEMDQAHMFILPSKTAGNGDMEGTPTVLLEAQASGLPVLSTYHADIPEVVKDGESGFLVAEGDVDDLAGKLEVLLSQPDLWSKFGLAARKHIQKHYNIRREVKNLEAIYQKLV